MSLSYAAEKIGNAVWHLAASPKPLQEPLADAWVEHLTHVYPPRDLTEDLRERWQMLRTLVTMDPNSDAGVGTYRDVIGAMSDDTASDAVGGILEMQHYVEVAMQEHGPTFPYFRLDDAGEPRYEPPPQPGERNTNQISDEQLLKFGGDHIEGFSVEDARESLMGPHRDLYRSHLLLAPT